MRVTKSLKPSRDVPTGLKAFIAAAVILAIIGGYFGYREHVDTTPAIPFSQLPADTQQAFVSAIAEGDLAWRFYLEEKNLFALTDALEFYSMAYAAHPHNRKAVKALRRAADAYLELHDKSPAERREAAVFLQGKSDYFLKYPPAVRAGR